MSMEVGRRQGYQGVRHNVAVKCPVAFPICINSAGLLSVRFPVRSPVIAPPGGAETGAQGHKGRNIPSFVAHLSAPLTQDKRNCNMSMSWLIIMFFINGTPALIEGFEPRLVLTSECWEAQQIIGALLAQAFPETAGIVFCALDNQELEISDVPA